jgi:hypothetical protein
MTEHAKYPFFPDNIQFWYETKRAFGVSSYRASEFGEVMWRYGIFSGSTLRTASSEVLATRSNSVLGLELLGAGKDGNKG